MYWCQFLFVMLCGSINQHEKNIFCCYSNRSIQFWLSANSKCIELESCAWFQFEDKPMQISYSKLFSLQFWLTISFFLFCCILSKKVKKNYMTTKKIPKRDMHYFNLASIWAQIQPSSSKRLEISDDQNWLLPFTQQKMLFFMFVLLCYQTHKA